MELFYTSKYAKFPRLYSSYYYDDDHIGVLFISDILMDMFLVHFLKDGR